MAMIDNLFIHTANFPNITCNARLRNAAHISYSMSTLYDSLPNEVWSICTTRCTACLPSNYQLHEEWLGQFTEEYISKSLN